MSMFPSYFTIQNIANVVSRCDQLSSLRNPFGHLYLLWRRVWEAYVLFPSYFLSLAHFLYIGSIHYLLYVAA